LLAIKFNFSNNWKINICSSEFFMTVFHYVNETWLNRFVVVLFSLFIILHEYFFPPDTN
jgi:hypothetical protein